MGPISRLISPAELGRHTKPFVLFDHFEIPASVGPMDGFSWHPHSGIATVSLLMQGEGWAEETDLERHSMYEDDVEWVMTGDGIWHTGGMIGDGRQMGLQLWLALPPDMENKPARTVYVTSDKIPKSGPARVISGNYDGVISPIIEPEGVTYLDVRLKGGEAWTFTPPAGQTVGLIAVYKGVLDAGQKILPAELVVFEESEDVITVQALEQDTRFVIGSAVKHPHDLVMSSYSIHTNAVSLEKGHQNIQKLGRDLQKRGLI